MNLLQALVKTYDTAAARHLVDVVTDEAIPAILPLYHSNKRATSDEDIIEFTINAEGTLLSSRFLPKDTYVIYPVSEGSIVRTSAPCPHPLCDFMSYVVPPVAGLTEKNHKKWDEKHTLYRQELEKLHVFCQQHPNDDFTAIYQYVTTHDVWHDACQLVQNTREGRDYTVEQDTLHWFEGSGDREKKCSLPLSPRFVTFAVERDGQCLSVTKNPELHRFYRDYVEVQNRQKPQEICDITGQAMYCSAIHRGVMGNAKLISVSNHKENYAGKLFASGEDVFHVGYETSQKIHNMLKYFLDAAPYNAYLGDSAYVISWLVQDLPQGGAPLLNDMDEDPFSTIEHPDQAVAPSEDRILGAYRSPDIVSYFTGRKWLDTAAGDLQFCTLIVEKVNNGRMAVKYFQTFTATDMWQRVQDWYRSLAWPYWAAAEKRWKLRAPSLRQIVRFLYGMESNGTITCSNDKVQRKALERLLSCIIEGKRLPRDMKQLALYRLQQRQAYKKCWLQAFYTGCALFKKFHWDHGQWDTTQLSLAAKGVETYMKNRSYTYGRLLAAYEYLETAALTAKQGNEHTGTAESVRTTNAERLWSAMMHRPLQTAALLETRTKPYRNALLQKNRGLGIRLKQLFAELYADVESYDGESTQRTQSTDEDFVLGYYYQNRVFYTKKEQSNN